MRLYLSARQSFHHFSLPLRQHLPDGQDHQLVGVNVEDPPGWRPLRAVLGAWNKLIGVAADGQDLDPVPANTVSNVNLFDPLDVTSINGKSFKTCW
jgi:hypothetical protein